MITTYTFNTHKAKHTFCSICGVQSFYYPRSNPDGVGVMPHCISGDIMDKSQIEAFNGKNWEKEMKAKKNHMKKFSQQLNTIEET